MVIVERQIQKVRPGKWKELEELDKEWTAIESRYGYPAKMRYRYISGGHDWDTLVVERQWESFAATETAVEKLNADPEAQALDEKTLEIIESTQLEFLQKLE